MGWDISHGTNKFAEMRRTYGTIEALANHVADVLPAAEWRRLQPILTHSPEPFEVPPHLAASTAELLRKAAAHRRMPADWADQANEMADTAERAANRDEMWRWR